MSTFLFAGFESLSEFINGLHGDCGPLALLLCLHVRDPKRYPLDKAGLAALVADMAAKGCLMRADGESNIPGLDKYLTAIGVPHDTVGYDRFRIEGLHARLKALDSFDPRLVLVEWSAAGKGLHDDEANVAYHYSSFGGIDTTKGYFRGDGDSRTDDQSGKATAPILTGWPSIVEAQPIGYIVIDVPAALKPHPAPVPTPKPQPVVPPVPPKPAPAPAQPVSTGINLLALFQAAAAYLPLSPGQRAVLKLVEGLAITGGVAALPIVAQAMAHQPVSWPVVLQAAAGAALAAIFAAVLKYAKAHADPSLS